MKGFKLRNVYQIDRTYLFNCLDVRASPVLFPVSHFYKKSAAIGWKAAERRKSIPQVNMRLPTLSKIFSGALHETL